MQLLLIVLVMGYNKILFKATLNHNFILACESGHQEVLDFVYSSEVSTYGVRLSLVGMFLPAVLGLWCKQSLQEGVQERSS